MTRLVLRNSHGYLPPTQWASLLEQMPLLEHLTLYGTVTLDESFEYTHPPPPSTSVVILCLAEINFGDRAGRFGYARPLEHLGLPALRTLTVTEDVYSPHPIDIELYGYVFYVLASMLSTPAIKPLCCSLSLAKYLFNISLGRTDVEYPALRVPGDTESSSTHELSFVRLSFWCYDPIENAAMNNFSELTLRLAASPFLSDIRSLYISKGHKQKLPKDLSVLAQLRLVEKFAYTMDNSVGLLEVLARRAPDDNTAPLLFPAQTSLTLRHAKWQRHRVQCEHFPLLRQCIERMLTARKAMGVPLRELCLLDLRSVRSDDDLSWLKTPREDLTVIHWDGKCVRGAESGCIPCEHQKAELSS